MNYKLCYLYLIGLFTKDWLFLIFRKFRYCFKVTKILVKLINVILKINFLD